MIDRKVRACSAAWCLTVMGVLGGCHRGPSGPGANGGPVFPDSLPHRVMVEVLNAGGPPGSARAGMLLLRRARLDVVLFGNAGPGLAHRSRNEVLIRRGDTTGVGRIVAVLGGADVIEAPDSASMVDLTVLLGRQFVPPASTPP